MVSLRRKKGERSADGTMSLMDHLYELRRRMFMAVLGVLAGGIVGFIWYTVGIPGLGIKPLGEILIHPYCAVPSPPRIEFNGHGCSFLATTPGAALKIRLKSAIMAGTVISCPIWLYQLWSFVTPALYDKERRFAVTFVTSAAVLFVAGATLAYFVIQEGLMVLLKFGGSFVSAGLDPDSYFTFLVAMLIIFGVSFELPLLLIMLNMVGVVKGKALAKARRYSIFGMVVFAAIVVPGNDPITMSALAVALTVLYEVAVQVSKLHDKRKETRIAAETFANLSDDVASPMPGSADGTPDVAPVSAPEPVEQPDPLGDAT